MQIQVEIDFHPEDSWIFWRRSNVKNESSKSAGKKLNHQLNGVFDERLQSIGRLCGARSRQREEARFVGCWQSGGDFEGGEEAVGEG